MTFDAQMRIGSLEISAALLAVAVVAARPRVRAAAEIGQLLPMRVELEILEFGRPHSFEGRPPFEVGRGPELDLVLRDPEASRRHARFETRNGVVYVDDLKILRNGTPTESFVVIEFTIRGITALSCPRAHEDYGYVGQWFWYVERLGAIVDLADTEARHKLRPCPLTRK